jgi:type VI secretion system secreted protein VgrG
MGSFTQAGRPFRVDTPLDPDVLLLQRFHGDEGVSIPYHYTLELLSEEEAVDPAELLRQPMVITVNLQDGGERKIHGLVRRFTQMGQQEDLTFYSVELVPWLWFLTLSQDCKVFQNKSVLDIVQEVFDGLGYTDYDLRCSRTYAPREYCVQYRETHLNFVSRLLEEEGIFYFFEHTQDTHTLVLADMNSTCQACPGQDTVRMAVQEGPWQDEDVVTAISLESAVHLGKVTLRDYDFTRPSLNLETAAESEEWEEVYDYPGQYLELSEGERYAQLLLEEGTCGGEVVRGASSCRAFQSGFKTTLEEHYRPDANQEYLLLHVSHRGEAGDYRSWNTATLEYGNTFVCIPFATQYRPPRRARKPRIQGSQTAVVVGPAGEEVFTDEYGRIKIQFYWDRLGQRDQNSSLFVRVVSSWAGKGYGSISIPRIGNEVIVDFLEGNPDAPIVTGSVYNAEQNVPFELPGGGIQMGMKSRTSPGGGGSNEITLTDTAGEELINIHAQYDMHTTVDHDDTQTVTNARTITVNGTHTETIKKDTSITITEGNLTLTVSKGTADISVKKAVTETFEDTQATTVKKKISITSETADIVLTANTEIKLVAGASSLVLKKDGTINLIGKKVLVQGDDQVNITGKKISASAGDEAKMGVGNQNVTCDKQKVGVAGAAINASAVGMHEITGAVVKIN